MKLFAAPLSVVLSALLAASLTIAPLGPTLAAEPADPSIDDLMADATRHAGLLDVRIPEGGGQVLLVLDPSTWSDGLAGRYLFQSYLAAGLGSNPLGLDRGAAANTQLVALRPVGDKILVKVENWRYRADRGEAAEQRAVADSFSRSVIAALPILDRNKNRVVVDLTEFLKRDTLGISAVVAEREQGTLSLDADRSVVDTASVLAFPDNMEFQTWLTFTASEAGSEILATAPDATAITLVLHHSLVRLPPPGFEPRQFDPRSGAIAHMVFDFSSPLSEPIIDRKVVRHRLQKDASGETVEPIVYYLDPGAPEPIRSALIDGGAWWADAFASAGFPDGFRIEPLPANAHPLDVRYNIIHWVHRATRGWSYGGSVVDPRTGEIVKGYVLLGSQRVRQDRLIFEGLAGTAKINTGDPDDPVQLALARIRQLSAHEIGHTLGLQHNFAASHNGRSSVMDYPAPWIRVENGQLRFDQAYDSGIGEWDKLAIQWLYGPASEGPGLLDKAADDGLLFIRDSDGRGVGSAHAFGAVWDNGDDPVAALYEALEVRRIALDNFGPDRLAQGQSLDQLRRVLVPVYLFHRYQLDAAAKLIAGQHFQYQVNQEGNLPIHWVDGGTQDDAIDAILSALEPQALDIPASTLQWLVPFSRGFSDDPITDRELLPNFTGDAAFDPLASAEVAAGLALQALLHPHRAARLVDQHRRNNELPSFDYLLDRIDASVFEADRDEPDRLAEIRAVVQQRFVEELVALSRAASVSRSVASRADIKLQEIERRLVRAEEPAGTWIKRYIRRHFDHPPEMPETPTWPSAPPGSPIGG